MRHEQAVTSALAAVMRDHGRALLHDPLRFRAALSDVLGEQADQHRAAVDALVIGVEEGVPSALRESRRGDEAALRDELVGRLTTWGLTTERAAWAVDAWRDQVPPATTPPAPTDPDAHPVRASDPAPTALPEAAEPPAAPPTELPGAATPPVPEPAPATMVPEPAPATMVPEPAPATMVPEPAPATMVPEPAPATMVPEPDRADRAEPPADSPPELGDETGTGTDDVAPPDAGPISSGRRRWVLIAAATVLVLATGTGIALAGGGEDPTPPLPRATGTELIATPQGNGAAAAQGTVAMATTRGGVRLTAFSEVERVRTPMTEFAAPKDGRLIAFSLADWPCDQGGDCVPWQELGLEVAVGDRTRDLPTGAGEYVVAVPDRDTPVTLHLRGDGMTQTLSLLDGTPGPKNVTVLARHPRATAIDEKTRLRWTSSEPLAFSTGVTDTIALTTTIEGAELDWSVRGRNPGPTKAYLRLDAFYTTAAWGEPKAHYSLRPREIAFRDTNGKHYRAVDLRKGDSTADVVFVVPGDLAGGVFTIGGADLPADGYTYDLQKKTVKVTF